MAKKAKREFVNITSPAGIAIYPHLQVPDTKFDEDGDFRVKLKLGPECAEFFDRVTDEAKKCFEAEKKRLAEQGKAAAAKAVQLQLPYEPEFDEAGNETGAMIVSFKRKAVSKRRDNQGNVIRKIPVVIPIFDGAGNRIPPDVEVWGGSVLRVAFFITSFYAAAAKTAGATLRIKAVQVEKLVTRGGGDAADYGFGTDGEAVSLPNRPAAPASSDAEAPSTDDSEPEDAEGGDDATAF